MQYDHQHYFLSLYNSENLTATLVDAESYYSLTGTMTNGGEFGLEHTGGVITCKQECYYLFSGSANITTDKNATITFGLIVNGSPYAGSETPIYICNPNKYSSMSINRIIKLNVDDVIEVKAKSDTDATEVTVAYLGVSLVSMERC